ncbi:hypothetical protein GWC95_13405 [Sediminibacterium roseum]|uniref:Uncharacterized protein n=1 Tax=Sediminibacterium roseum TaxID=1978412 RepID=A0ABW9ZUV8_9BACT|nr:hypothetical protein [Sediminibacterium roseum]NCI50924.1 hypothetical protein [Sediminibacterium roseum]
MRKHNGMRPHDVVILLAIITKKKDPWLVKDLAAELCISQSEVSESLNRSHFGGLFIPQLRSVNRLTFFEFLKAGLPCVFPTKPGMMVNGIVTAHSHPVMKKRIVSSELYVWPELGGKDRGFAIDPFYEKQVLAAKKDDELYKLLAMVDALRVGRTRERTIAAEILNESILTAG